jgi:hypothetical protein
MVTGGDADQVEVNDNEMLRSARSHLEWAGRSAPEGIPFVVAYDVGTVYGQGHRLDDERALVQYALDFANGDTDRSEIKRLILSGKAKLQPKDADLTPAQQIELDHQMVEVAARAKRREFLSLLLHDREKAADLSFDRLGRQLMRFWSLPKLQRVPGFGIRRTPLEIMLDLQAFEAHVDSLLLDGSQSYGRDLCQCRLSSCARFFLAQKQATGRPQRLYCSRKHMLESHAQQSGKRAQRSRARKSANKGARKHK